MKQILLVKDVGYYIAVIRVLVGIIGLLSTTLICLVLGHYNIIQRGIMFDWIGW